MIGIKLRGRVFKSWTRRFFGKWHTTFFSPVVVCQELELLVNGNIQYSPNVMAPYLEGTNAEHICVPGFILIGNVIRVCQSDSTFSGVPPTCQRKLYLICLLCVLKARVRLLITKFNTMFILLYNYLQYIVYATSNWYNMKFNVFFFQKTNYQLC